MTTVDPSLRAVEVADVYKSGVLAARLRRAPDGVEFAYVDGYDGPAVATTLPVAAGARITPAGAVPPFFAGLLPEGRRLSSLRRRVKTSADDELSLLLAVGSDTVGDVVVVPEGAPPDAAAPVVSDGAFEEIRFADLLAEAGIVDAVALPGVQDKVSARVISLPAQTGSAGDRFILKLDPPEYPHVVENEAYFLGLARRAGLETVDAQVVRDADGRPGLLVRRFDRVAVDDTIRALPCEDACQLLDRWPADKYNVSSEDVAAAVKAVCTSPVLAARAVFRQLCFAWLTANGDVHAKNISVLRDLDGEWHVAPAYDLPCTAPYADRSLALPLEGSTTGLSRRKLLAFAGKVGLPERAAVRVLEEQLAATAGLVDDIRAGALPFDGHTNHETARVLRHRRTQLEG